MEEIQRKKTLYALALICLGAIILRLLCFGGYEGSDDMVYADFAYKMSKGDFRVEESYSGPTVFPLRKGLIAPVALGFKLLGPGEGIVIGYPFIVSILSILLAFLIGKAFFNLRAGLIAASIQAIIPIDVRFASVLIPDLIGAFWGNLGILLIFYASQKDGLERKCAYGILAGLALGISWLCKETVAYILPFVVFYTLWLTLRSKRNTAIFISAFLTLGIILTAEGAVYYKYTHDFLYRFHMVEKSYQFDTAQYGATWGWEKGREGLILILRRLFYENPRIMFMNTHFSFIAIPGLLALAYALSRKLRGFFLPGIWFISLVIIFSFGSASLKSYRPLALYQYRYMYGLLLPAIILTAGFLDSLVSSRGQSSRELERERLFWAGALAAGILLISLFGAVRNIWQGRYSKVERIVSRLLSPQGRVIYTDQRSAQVLRLFWKYPEQAQIHDFSCLASKDLSSGAYVLVNRDRSDFLNSKYGYCLPQFYEKVPSDWSLKWSNKRAQLYRVP